MERRYLQQDTTRKNRHAGETYPHRAPDYTDVVLVTQLHSYIGTDRASKLPKFAEVPAFRKIAVREFCRMALRAI